MTKTIIHDPHDFLQVSIEGKTTEQLRQEAVERQEWARTVLHDASDRLPQWTNRSDLGFNVERGPEKHVHSMEDSMHISRAQSMDGNEVNPRLYPEGKREGKMAAKPPYQYDARGYNPSDENVGYQPKAHAFETSKRTKVNPGKDKAI